MEMVLFGLSSQAFKIITLVLGGVMGGVFRLAKPLFIKNKVCCSADMQLLYTSIETPELRHTLDPLVLLVLKIY